MKAKDERKFADQLTWRWGYSACLGGSTVIRKILTHGMAIGDREWGRHVKDSAWHYGLQMTEVMSQGRQVSSRSWKKRQVDFLFRNFLIEYNSIPSLAKRKTFLTFDFELWYGHLCGYKQLTWGKWIQESLATTTRRYHQERSKTAKWRREEQNPILGKLSSPSLSILLILQQEAHRQLLLLSTQRPEQSQQQFAASIYCLLTRRKHCPEPLTLIISLNPGNNLRQQAPLLSPFYWWRKRGNTNQTIWPRLHSWSMVEPWLQRTGIWLGENPRHSWRGRDSQIE